MGRKPQKLELRWFNKDRALIPGSVGGYDYAWVDPKDPRYCETHTLVYDEKVFGEQSPKKTDRTYSQRADLEPTDDNLVVLGESGDVLEALTHIPELVDKYVGKVQCVYIDPPFNTSKTFVNYEDNLEHSIWLTMMRDRLIHLHKLLADEGSIWIHLNDVENHRMRLLLDEVFGPGNFVAEVVWEKSDSPRRGDGFSDDHDNIIVYGKSKDVLLNKMPRTGADNARFKNPDNDPKGPWWDSDPTANNGDGGGGMCYAIQNPLTGEMMRPGVGRNWALTQRTYFDELNKWAPYRYENLHDAQWRAKHEGVLVEKASDDVCAIVLDVPLDESSELVEARRQQPNLPRILIRSTGGLGYKAYIPVQGTNPRTLWRNDEVGHNRNAKSEIKALFRGEAPFATPKPERMLERVIQIATNPGDVVLDVFAGSGTTAAVAQKMGRRWVTCELVYDTLNRFLLPRLNKVIRDQDPKGVTVTEGERVDATAHGLPEDVSAQDAFRFGQLLSKLLADRDTSGTNPDDDEPIAPTEFENARELVVEPRELQILKKSKDIKALKALAKTRKTKDTINWRGGGGYVLAHLSPQCFDYDPELDLVMLTEAATGPVLIESVVANLNFRRTPDHRYFHGARGSMRLMVVEGRLSRDKVDDLVAHLDEEEGLTIAATEIEDGVRQYLRATGRGCRAVHIPDGIFTYATKGV